MENHVPKFGGHAKYEGIFFKKDAKVYFPICFP